MGNDTGDNTKRLSVEITSQSLNELREDVINLLDEIDEFLSGGEKATPRIGKDVTEFIDETAEDLEEVKAEQLLVASDIRKEVSTPNVKSKAPIEIEAQMIARLENEAVMRMRIIKRLKQKNTETNVVKELPTNKKRKIEVIYENKPHVQRLVLPEKRKQEFDHRQSVGKRFKIQAVDNTSVSVPSSACAHIKDLRQVLQRRRGVSF